MTPGGEALQAESPRPAVAMMRPCPKCQQPVAVTPKRQERGRYTCNACSAKAVTEWSRRPGNIAKFKASASVRSRNWQLRNPDRVKPASEKRLYDRRHHLKKKYGITQDDYEALLASQGHRCAICLASDPSAMFGRWHIDHCHETGVVRGLLCAKCNLGLGSLGDTEAELSRALEYVRKARR